MFGTVAQFYQLVRNSSICPKCGYAIRDGGKCMRCNNKGQTGAGEVVIIMILIIVIGGLTYLLYTKKSDTQIFKSGAQSVEPRITPSFGGCAIVKEYTYANPNDKNNRN